MQKTISIAFVAIWGSATVVAACGGRIEGVSETRDPGGGPGASGSFDDERAGEGSAVPSAPSEPDTPSSPPSRPLPASCATFDQVLATLDGLGCSAGVCHGSANLPLVDVTKPLETKRGFYAFVMSNGMRYVDFRSLDPEASAMACNLRGSCGVPMPLGGPPAPASAIDIVDRWLACGAPP